MKPNPGFLVLVVMLSCMIKPARADEPCAGPSHPWEQDQIRHLTSDIAGVASAAAAGGGDALFRRLEADYSLPRARRRALLRPESPVSVAIIARVAGGATPTTVASTHPASLRGAYEDSMKVGPAVCDGLYCRSRAELYRRLENLLDQPEAAIVRAYGDVGIGIDASQARQMRAYHHIIFAGTEQAALTYIRAHRDQLSRDETLSVVSMYLGRKSADYDERRADDADPAALGRVPGDRLLTAARLNTIAGEKSDSAGICRDSHAQAVKFLKAYRVPHSLMLGFDELAGGHAVTISRTGPRTSTVLNWDERSDRPEVDGGLALFMPGNDDSSLHYELSDEKGRNVKLIESETGKFLTEASGFDVRGLDPLTRTTGSIASTVLSAGAANGVQLGAVTGEDGLGATYVGATGTAHYLQATHFPGRIGTFIGTQSRPAEVFGTAKDEQILLAYSRLEQHATTSRYRIGEGATLQLDAAYLREKTQMVLTKTRYDKQSRPEGNQRLNAEVRVEHGARRATLVHRIGAQTGIDQPDQRTNGDEGSTLFFNHAHVSSHIEAPFGRALRLVADGVVVADRVSLRGRAAVGVASTRFAVTGQIAGRVTDSSALYNDSSIRRAGIGVTFRPRKSVTLNAGAEMPIEGADALARLRVTGGAVIRTAR